MSYLRHARKVDKTQPLIVEAIKRAGYLVYPLGLPVDLMVRHPNWTPNVFVMLECKTPTTNGKVRMRKDRLDQQTFCDAHQTPYVTDPESALKYLDMRGARLFQ